MSNTHPTSNTSYSDDMISTLAKENGWMSDDDNPLYYYQGFWYHGIFLKGVIASQAQEMPGFNPSPSDIVISSCPKSGTTWLKALSFAISTRTLFPIEQHSQDHPLRYINPHELMRMIEFYKDSAMCNPDRLLLSTHIPYTSLPSSIVASRCKIVYIWRDPKDAFISTWHFYRKVRVNKDVTEHIPLEEAFDLFCRGISPYGSLWDHVLGYWKAFLECPDVILFLKYEDMINDAEAHVKRLAEFMGYPFSNVEEKEGVVARIVEMCSFESLSKLEGKKLGENIDFKGKFSFTSNALYRKGKVGDWKNYLTEEMAVKIDQITNDKLGAYGLKL